MIYEVVPTKALYIRPMAAKLRRGLAVGGDVRRVLHDTVTQSYFCRTAVIEGRPEAMWGLWGPLLSDAPYVWLAMSDKAIRLPKMAVQEARRQLEEMRGESTELVTGVSPDDRASIAFAVFLGFKGKLADVSAQARDRVVDELLEDPRHRVPAGMSYEIALSWRGGR